MHKLNCYTICVQRYIQTGAKHVSIKHIFTTSMPLSTIKNNVQLQQALLKQLDLCHLPTRLSHRHTYTSLTSSDMRNALLVGVTNSEPC